MVVHLWKSRRHPNYRLVQLALCEGELNIDRIKKSKTSALLPKQECTGFFVFVRKKKERIGES